MPHDPPFHDPAAQERKLGAELFNKTWDYIDKAARTPAETEAMLHCAHASFWHWSQFPGVTGENFNIGYWQLSRVYALAGQGAMAAHWGECCRKTAYEHDLAPFYKAYAWEALARAAQVLGDAAGCAEYLQEAVALLPQILKKDELDLIEPDLAQLR